MPHAWTARVRELTLDLTRYNSITDTPGEQTFPDHLVALLKRLPYFNAHPEDLRVLATLNDPLPRRTIYALVRGNGKRTVVLGGHFDVVEIDAFGPLAPLAFDPEALAEPLAATLGGLAADELRDGTFLSGRGVLDMKSGLAIGVALLERFAQLDERVGNLLLVATPDEEGGSHGMRSAARQLAPLAAEWDLDLAAALNLDISVDQGDGSEGRVIYTGSVGKLLPVALAIGQPTHAGMPFDGLNASLIAAELIRRIEGAGDIGEAPPVTLQHLDLKAGYNVTVPHHSWCAFNVLTRSSGPADVLAQIHTAAAEALTAAIALHAERGRAWAVRAAHIDLTFTQTGTIWHVADLLERAPAELRDRVEALAGDPTSDILAGARAAFHTLAQGLALAGPGVLIGYAPIFYPIVRVADDDASGLIPSCERHAAALAAETGQSIGLRTYFPAISDMSFLAGPIRAADLAAWTANTPGTSRWPLDARACAGLPTVNIGPWGRDAHQIGERVHAGYAFGIVPELAWRVALELMGSGERGASS